MKKLLQIVAFVLLGSTAMTVKAQTKVRLATGVTSQCLTGTFGAEGTLLADSCAQFKWAITGNGTTAYAYGTKVTYTFPAAGTYTVCGRLYNSCKKFDTSICKTITVVSCDCKLTTEFSFSTDCKKVKFKATSNQAGAKFTWNFGDKTTGTGVDPVKSYLSEGVYKVCVTATWIDSTGKTCTATFCREIKVSCGTPCDLKGEFGFVNTGGKFRFKASSNKGYTYSWDFGDGKTGKGIDPYHEYAKAGTYTVCLTITDKTGKCKIKICKTVTVGNPCGIIGGMTWKKTNDTTWKFFATSNTGTGTTYFWNWGDGTTSTGKDATHVYKKAGTYEVCLKIYDTKKKCFVYICRKIVVTVGSGNVTKCNWAAAGATLSYSNKTACNTYFFEGKNMNLNGGNCIKYTIVVGNSGASTTYKARTATHTFTTNGTYNVCIKYYDSCKACDTLICTSVKVDCCNAKASFQVDSVSSNGKMYVKNTSTGAKSFLWSFGDSTANSKDKTPIHQFSASGTYTVCLTAYDSTGTCSTVYCYTVKVLKTRGKTSIQGLQGSSYPNPADHGFYLDLSGGTMYTVYNTTGQIIANGQGDKLTYVETANWSEGNYRIVLKNASGVQTISTVIAH